MTMINEKQAAYRLGCSVYKLQKDRVRGTSLPYYKIGRSVRYRPEDIETHISKQKFTSTAQYGGEHV